MNKKREILFDYSQKGRGGKKVEIWSRLLILTLTNLSGIPNYLITNKLYEAQMNPIESW